MNSVVVVGASLAGVEAARTLRAEGFDGELTLVGAEPHQPYDRPPLSKGYLSGAVRAEDLALDVGIPEVEWHLGVRAVGLDPAAGVLALSDGITLVADAFVVATGARARRLRTTDEPVAGVHTLRTLDDADALQKDLQPGARLVVVGGGFIGAEVAATAHGLGLEVTVVEVQPLPLRAQLGDTVARGLADLHAAHGVGMVTSASVEALTGTETVTGVRLQDGRELPADVVVVGVGSQPQVDWLRDSGLGVGDGLLCDATGSTGAPNVVAAGDCAAWWSEERSTHVRRQHWTAAMQQAGAAARRLLHGAPATGAPAPPVYIWSDQYDVRIQLAGSPGASDDVHVIEGALGSGPFLAVYQAPGGHVSAVVAMNQPRLFGRWRRSIGQSYKGQ